LQSFFFLLGIKQVSETVADIFFLGIKQV